MIKSLKIGFKIEPLLPEATIALVPLAYKKRFLGMSTTKSLEKSNMLGMQNARRNECREE